MHNFLPELIRFNVPFIIVLVLVSLAALAAWWLYRRVAPPLTKASQYVLLILRATILFLVLLLFFTPRFIITFQVEKQPGFGIFTDNSASMAVRDNDRPRWQETIAARQQVQAMLPPSARLGHFTFNSGVEEHEADAGMDVSGFATNFSALLDAIRKENFDKVIIISDGNHTEGSYPLTDRWPSMTTLYTVGIGNIETGIDVSIDNVRYPALNYVNKKSDIEVQISSRGLPKNERLQMRLFLDKRLITAQFVELEAGSYQHSVFFEYIPGRTGLNRLRVEIDSLGGEKNWDNNSYTFVQNILKSKIKVGLISGLPSYDSKFLNLLLSRNEDVELFTFTETPRQRAFEGSDNRHIDSLEVIILCGFPGPYSQQNQINRLMNVLKTGNSSTMIFLTRHTDINKLQAFRDYLPFESVIRNRDALPVAVSNPAEMSVNPILFLFDRQEILRRYWGKLPPVDVYFSVSRPKANSRILLNAAGDSETIPLLTLADNPLQRMVLFNGEGFWKWYFLLQNDAEIVDGYAILLNHLVRWGSDQSKIKAVALESRQTTTTPGSEINIRAALFDANYQPLKDGQLVVQALWNDQEFTLPVIPDSAGNFQINFLPPGEGKFVITARGFKDGIEIGSDRLEIEVIPTDKEFIRVSQNRDFLNRLAVMSNGRYVDAADLDTLRQFLAVESELTFLERIFDIWYKPFLLILILLLITMEWILRKRYNLV